MTTPLARIREAKSQTAAEVARAVECDKSHYGRVEKGDVTPSPALAAKIAAHFGHAITELQIIYPERYTEPAKAS